MQIPLLSTSYPPTMCSTSLRGGTVGMPSKGKSMVATSSNTSACRHTNARTHTHTAAAAAGSNVGRAALGWGRQWCGGWVEAKLQVFHPWHWRCCTLRFAGLKVALMVCGHACTGLCVPCADTPAAPVCLQETAQHTVMTPHSSPHGVTTCMQGAHREAVCVALGAASAVRLGSA